MLALVIVFLVMAVLFERFVYPLIIMLSVPVAAAGGLACSWRSRASEKDTTAVRLELR